MTKALVLIPEVRLTPDMNPQTGNGVTTQTGNGVTSQTGNGVTSQTGNGMNPQTGNGITSQTGNGMTTQLGNGVTSQTGKVFSRRVNISILHGTPVPFIINILHLVREFYFGSFYHLHFTSGEKILLWFL
jgi:hypothetical protein